MSHECVFEIAVHLESIRNIDLLRQGLYYLSCRAYTVNDSARQLSAIALQALPPQENEREVQSAFNVRLDPSKSNSNDKNRNSKSTLTPANINSYTCPNIVDRVCLPYNIPSQTASNKSITIAQANRQPPKPSRSNGVVLPQCGDLHCATSGCCSCPSAPVGTAADHDDENDEMNNTHKNSTTSNNNSKHTSKSVTNRSSSHPRGSSAAANRRGQTSPPSALPSEVYIQKCTRDCGNRCICAIEDYIELTLFDNTDEEDERDPSSRLDPRNNRLFGSAQIDPSNYSFSSQIIRIRYTDQQIILNDLCVFRIEVPPPSSFSTQALYGAEGSTGAPGGGAHNGGDGPDVIPLYLDISLHYYDFAAKNFDCGDPIPSPNDFHLVSTRTLCIRDIFMSPVHAYYPVVFDTAYHARAHIMVHSALIEHRLRSTTKHGHTHSHAQASGQLTAAQSKAITGDSRKTTRRRLSFSSLTKSRSTITTTTTTTSIANSNQPSPHMSASHENDPPGIDTAHSHSGTTPSSISTNTSTTTVTMTTGSTTTSSEWVVMKPGGDHATTTLSTTSSSSSFMTTMATSTRLTNASTSSLYASSRTNTPLCTPQTTPRAAPSLAPTTTSMSFGLGASPTPSPSSGASSPPPTVITTTTMTATSSRTKTTIVQGDHDHHKHHKLDPDLDHTETEHEVCAKPTSLPSDHGHVITPGTPSSISRSLQYLTPPEGSSYIDEDFDVDSIPPHGRNREDGSHFTSTSTSTSSLAFASLSPHATNSSFDDGGEIQPPQIDGVLRTGLRITTHDDDDDTINLEDSDSHRVQRMNSDDNDVHEPNTSGTDPQSQQHQPSQIPSPQDRYNEKVAEIARHKSRRLSIPGNTIALTNPQAEHPAVKLLAATPVAGDTAATVSAAPRTSNTSITVHDHNNTASSVSAIVDPEEGWIYPYILHPEITCECGTTHSLLGTRLPPFATYLFPDAVPSDYYPHCPFEDIICDCGHVHSFQPSTIVGRTPSPYSMDELLTHATAIHKALVIPLLTHWITLSRYIHSMTRLLDEDVRTKLRLPADQPALMVPSHLIASAAPLGRQASGNTEIGDMGTTHKQQQEDNNDDRKTNSNQHRTSGADQEGSDMTQFFFHGDTDGGIDSITTPDGEASHHNQDDGTGIEQHLSPASGSAPPPVIDFISPPASTLSSSSPPLQPLSTISPQETIPHTPSPTIAATSFAQETYVPLGQSIPNIRPLCERLLPHETHPILIARLINDDVQYLSQECFTLWTMYTDHLQYVSRRLRRLLLIQWRKRQAEVLQSRVFCEQFLVDHAAYLTVDQTTRHNQKIINTIRLQHQQGSEGRHHAAAELTPDLRLESAGQASIVQQPTLMFEEEYRLSEKKAPYVTQYEGGPTGKERFWKRYSGDGVHLIVLCHGYQGGSWDMRMIKNALFTINPRAEYLVSEANQGKTESSFETMGERLAEEIYDYIRQNCPRGIRQLSFVAHSMGGIIVRAALLQPILHPYLRCCYTYVSMATPHCGFSLGGSQLVSTGLWFLRKWTKASSLTQLSLNDASNPSKAYLVQLSKQNVLQFFRHVYVLSSRQDSYSPFPSARIQKAVDASDPKRCDLNTAMVASLLSHLTIRNRNLSRILRPTCAEVLPRGTECPYEIHHCTLPTGIVSSNDHNQIGSNTTTDNTANNEQTPPQSLIFPTKKKVLGGSKTTYANAPARFREDEEYICACFAANECTCDFNCCVPQQFRRIEFHFPDTPEARFFDTFIGRSAHISFLDQQEYLDTFLSLHWRAFL